jgi:hypothetical protein
MTFPEYERFEAKGATTIDAWLKKLEEEQKADRGPKFLLGPRTPQSALAPLLLLFFVGTLNRLPRIQGGGSGNVVDTAFERDN